MTNILIKVTRLSPRIKNKTIEFGKYYPLTVVNKFLEEIRFNLNGTHELTFTLLDLSNDNQEIIFSKLELDNKFRSLTYLINEDITKTERESDFDVAEQLRHLSLTINRQWDEELLDVTPFQLKADELNANPFSALASLFSKKEKKEKTPVTDKPRKKEKKKIISKVNHPAVNSEIISSELVTPTETSPIIWEDEADDTQVQVTSMEKETHSKPSPSIVDVVEGPLEKLSFESYLTTDLIQEHSEQKITTLLNELEDGHQSQIETIAKWLGISVNDPSPLEKKELAYLEKNSNRQFFQTLQTKLTDNIRFLDDSLQKKLEKTYLESGLTEHDLQEFVTAKSLEHVESMTHQFNEKTQELTDTLTRSHESKLETLASKHELELQELKARQAEERQQVTADFDVYRDSQLSELSAQQSELMASEKAVFETTLLGSRIEELTVSLLSEKRGLLSKKEVALTSEYDSAVAEREAYFQSLRQELDDKQEEFLLLVEAEEARRLQEEELSLKEKELLLKEKEVEGEISTRETEERQRQQQHEALMGLLQAKLLESSSPAQQTVGGLPSKIDINIPQAVAPVKSPSVLKKYLVGIGAVMAIGGGLLGTELYEANTTNATLKDEISSMREEYKQVALAVTSIEKENNQLKSTLEEKEQSLEYLLSIKDYETAIDLYGSELNAIETAMYEEGNLNQLKTFNSTYKSTFGLLDEAILRGNDADIVSAYTALSPQTKLPFNRKSFVLTALYQVGEWWQANTLFNEN